MWLFIRKKSNNSLYNIIDSYFVARVSENAMTALALVFPVQNLINAIAIGFGIGVSALLSLRIYSRETAAKVDKKAGSPL